MDGWKASRKTTTTSFNICNVLTFDYINLYLCISHLCVRVFLVWTLVCLEKENCAYMVGCDNSGTRVHYLQPGPFYRGDIVSGHLILPMAIPA